MCSHESRELIGIFGGVYRKEAEDNGRRKSVTVKISGDWPGTRSHGE